MGGTYPHTSSSRTPRPQWSFPWSNSGCVSSRPFLTGWRCFWRAHWRAGRQRWSTTSFSSHIWWLKTNSGYCKWVEIVSPAESLNGFCKCMTESWPPRVKQMSWSPEGVFLLHRKVPARWDLCAKTDATNLVLHLNFTGNRMSCYTSRAWWVPPGPGLTDLITKTFDTGGTYPGTDREPCCSFHLSLSGTVGRWFRSSR